MTSFSKTIRYKKHWWLGVITFNLYFMVYYWSIDYLNFGVSGSLIRWSPMWRSLIFKPISSFLFEPIGVIQNFGIQLFIAPVNILIGLVLSGLVFLNITASLYIYKLPKQCRLDHNFNGLIGILPSFLTGFACCAPTFLISLSSVIGSSASFLSPFFAWLLPLSFIFLIWGLRKSYKIIQMY